MILRHRAAAQVPTKADTRPFRPTSWKLLPLTLILAGVLPLTGMASERPTYDRGAVLIFNEENDLFVNTDRHYTQGIRFAYLHKDGHAPLGMAAVSAWLPAWGFDLKSSRSGYAAGQNLYTPADLTTVQRLGEDRPYAGWLYAGWILQRNGVTHKRGFPVQESWELEVGTLGSPSLGRQSQIWVHEIRGFDLPQGWRNQLRDEPGFRLKFERAYRLDLSEPEEPVGIQFIPWGGGVVGTIEDTVRAGGMVRLGWHLTDDFGLRSIDSLSTTSGGLSKSAPRHWSVQGFVGSEGRVVGRNTFLDGNLYRQGQSVNKHYLVGDFFIGFNLTLHHIELGYLHVFRTPEFKNQTEVNQFGSIYAKISF